MKYMVEVTRIDHRAGEVRTWRDKKRYKTLRNAEKAAMGWNNVTRPDGKTTTTDTMGRVVCKQSDFSYFVLALY